MFSVIAQKLIIFIIIFSLPRCVAGGRCAKPVPGNDVKPRARCAAWGARALLCHVPGQVGVRAVSLPRVPVHSPARSHQGPGVGQPVREPNWAPPSPTFRGCPAWPLHPTVQEEGAGSVCRPMDVGMSSGKQNDACCFKYHHRPRGFFFFFSLAL